MAIRTTVFERLLAMTRERGNFGFMMYPADTVGYLGYVADSAGWFARRVTPPPEARR